MNSPTQRAGGPGTFPYRLIATDLDGTLLRTDGTVSERSRAALAAATAAGAAHVVVTGRGVAWTRPVLDRLGYRGLAVCGQGGQLYHAGEDRLVTSVTLDRRLAGAAIAKIEAEVGTIGLAAVRDGVDGEVLLGPGFRPLGSLPCRTARDTAELLSAPIGKLYLQHPTLRNDELVSVARSLAGALVGVMMSGDGIVELLPQGLTKATGLSLAARRLESSGAEAIAFGDMPNDAPMFGWAAYAVAMADAHPEVKAVADEVTSSADDDGVAVVLERLLG